MAFTLRARANPGTCEKSIPSIFSKPVPGFEKRPWMARRAQRTGRAHLRVPVDEMIFANFYKLWAGRDPQGRLVAKGVFR